MNSLKDGDNFKIQNNALNKNIHIKKKIKRVKSVNAIREKQWDDRFIYDKIPNYDSSNDKNVLINFRTKCNSSRKKLGNIIRSNPLSFIDNSLYLYRPLSNKTTMLHPLINGKNVIKTISAKTRDINFRSNRNIDYYKNYYMFDSNNKILDEFKKKN